MWIEARAGMHNISLAKGYRVTCRHAKASAYMHILKFPVQVLKEVVEAMNESFQKQQRTFDEVQQRSDHEASMSGSHKQRSKDLKELLSMENTKLQRKEQNLKVAESLVDSRQGERSGISSQDRLG